MSMQCVKSPDKQIAMHVSKVYKLLTSADT